MKHKATIKQVISSISKIRNEDLDRLKALAVTCDTTSTMISSVLNELELLKHSGEEDQVFVATTKAESLLQVLDDRLDSVVNDNKITRYIYVCEPRRTTVAILGKKLSLKDRRAFNVDDLNVKTLNDTSDCCITGMKTISDNRLVIADYNNVKIKLVDMTSKTVISELMLDWTPWDLARIDDYKIAVTTDEIKKILVVSISNTLTVHKTIDKSGCDNCQSIVCSNNTLIVSYVYPRQIEILNLDGTVKHVIADTDAHGTVRFGDVEYLTQVPDTNILYLSDTSSHKVSSMTLGGQVISSCTHEYLISPTGITLCRDGRIYVCSSETNKIVEISSDLTEGRVILDESDGIKEPYSILFDE